MSRSIRMLSHLPTRLVESVRKEFPDVEIVSIPMEGPIPDHVSGEILLTLTSGAPNLEEVLSRGVRWVHAYGTGVDRFPFEILGTRRMTCSRGASARAISEWVLAVMLAFEKHLPESWISEPPKPPARWNVARLGTLQDKNLALIGFGGIGQAIAQRALAFGMKIQALRRTTTTSPIEDVRIVTSLDELLTDADHLVVVAPETPSTRRMVDESAFSLMKPGVHLVNVARGGLIDQDALERALDRDVIARATLDCVYPEPLPADHWLYSHPRVRLSPHVSWSAPRSHADLIEPFVENLGRYSRGEELRGMVDPAQGY